MFKIYKRFLKIITILDILSHLQNYFSLIIKQYTVTMNNK